MQGNKISNVTINNEEKGTCLYDERGNMTQNVEAGLQFSYNLCNLPKQITAENGTTVKYTYFADGTKFKTVDATGNGFAYTGSLRWSIQGGEIAPESIAITGGRALYDDIDESWSANYYITDHLGSVRVVTDAEGNKLDTYDYMPYGRELIADTDNITDYRFTGKEKQTVFGDSNIYDSFARFQNTYGRFMSIDPKAESFYHISPYTYCAGDPVNLVDPDGEVCGVYYDEYGNYIADDNIDNGKLYITNKETADLWDKEMRVSGDISNALNILQSGSTEVDGIIIITRTSETQQYTRGEFLAIGSNNFSGYTMERPGPASYEAGKKLPIPRGLYDTIEREGQFHGTFAFRIFNDKVSIKRGILGHIGNTPDDSEGCILFGMGMGSGNSISQSKIAMTKFEVYFQNKDNVRLIIR